MRLLELIPTPDADPALIAAVTHFCDAQLGKGVVLAKDTPNFIANRIGTFSVLNVMRLMQEMDLSVEDVDALTGQAVGWPRSATFRTIDLVGLDILGHVVSNMTQNVKDERSDCRFPTSSARCSNANGSATRPKAASTKRPKARTPIIRKTSVSPSIGRRSNIIPARSRNSPRSIWRRTSKTPAARVRMLLGTGRRLRRSPTRPHFPLDRALRSVDLLRQPHSRNFRLRSSKSIAPCASASTGNSAPSNSGTPPASKPPSPA
jgi:hypothetical protein